MKIPSGAGSEESSSFQRAAPVGGWNTRDALATMPPNDAVFLDNWFPGPGGVRARKGYTQFAQIPADTIPSPHAIRSLLTYNSPTGTKTAFAVANDGFYDVSVGGTQTTVSTPATNSEWQSVNTSTAGGNFLWCCNGVDKSRYWDGAAWLLLDGASAPALTGVTSTSVINVSLFKTRLMLTCIDSLSFWYLPVNSVAGAAAEFPLGAIFKRGGYLMATETWTIDSGFGFDDKFVAITSEGELVVYSGTDPSSAANWAMQGLFYCGKPLGRRCFVRLGGDMCVLTVSGIVSITKLLNSSLISRSVALTDKISNFFNTIVNSFGDNFGWQATVFPEEHMLVINVPLGNLTSWQFVMNTDSGAWCRFLGQNSEVWAYFDGHIYFALSNKVYKAWYNFSDNGNAIDTRVKCAFQRPTGGRNNQIRLARPTFSATAGVTVSLAIDTDYADQVFTNSSTTFGQTVAAWDTAVFDASYWSGSLAVSQWRTVNHKPGRAFSFRMRSLVLNVDISWTATDFIVATGGLL